jgi:ribosomal protein S27AE
MPPRQKCICPCGYVFFVDHHRSASFLGLLVRDSQKIQLESTKCPSCGKKLALHSQGPNPLGIEK